MFGDWQEIMEEFLARGETARAMGGAEKMEKRRAAGLLNARERIEALVDPDSFQELGTLVGACLRAASWAAPQ